MKKKHFFEFYYIFIFITVLAIIGAIVAVNAKKYACKITDPAIQEQYCKKESAQ